MAKETPTMSAGGTPFKGWTSVMIRAALNEAAREFHATVTEIPDGSTGILENWHFPPNTPVEWRAGSDLMLAGYIDSYKPRGDSRSHTITIDGRGKGRDFADTSVMHSTGQFEERSVEEIARELDTGKAGVTAKVNTGPPVKVFRVQQGSSPHSQILRLAQQRKLTVKGAADGSMELTRAGTTRHAGALVHGATGRAVKIKTYEGDISARYKFSDVITIGQSAKLFEDPQLRPNSKSTDTTQKTGRTRVRVDQAETDPTLARQGSDWELSRLAGNGAQANLVVFGWRDEKGTLWEPGNLVYVEHRLLHLKQDMLVVAVEFQQDIQGTVASLTLMDPRSFAGDESKYSDSDEEFWGQ